MSVLSTPQAVKSIYINQLYEVLLGNIFTCKNFSLRRFFASNTIRKNLNQCFPKQSKHYNIEFEGLF